MQLGSQRGTLKIWKGDRGFGFITPREGGDDVFVHISEFKVLTRRPQVGDLVGYDTVVTKHGKRRARNAFIVGAQAKRSIARGWLTNQRSWLFLWGVVPLLLLPLGCSLYWAWQAHNPLWVVIYPVMSGLTYRVYANDKLRAQTDQWRISEKTLHILELLGGWPGGLIAQQILRHKTQKTSYQITFWSLVALHYVGWLGWLVL
jgi:uncharacterized membrane protein YsdA (DUF1294 family)/cold shock CspA family protein